jgi:phage portal protein BeeE
MTYQRVGFSAHEDEWLDNAKLSFAMVASVYHVNPTMVGLLDNANFSNVREFRKQLYGDTLGSTISMIEDRINTFLVPRVTGTADAYVEFNIAEKLRGNFEEQAQALSSATGRPWMTADEARGINNMRSLGGDAAELVTPLNVLIGGQASPVDSGSQNVVPDPEQPKSLTPA